MVMGLGAMGWVVWSRGCGGRSVVAPFVDVVPRLAPDALAGTTIVLDPGHGGTDPGSMEGGVGEAALTYRMAATLREVFLAAGARVSTTVRAEGLSGALREGVGEAPLALPRDAVFSVDGAPVKVDSVDHDHLYRRADVGAAAWRGRSPGERVLFVSVHFDAVPATDVRGAAVRVDPRGEVPAVARQVSRWLVASGISGSRPVIGPQELGVLNPLRNPVPERFLLELATLTDGADRASVMSSAWRWRAARAVAAAIAGIEPPAVGVRNDRN
ncbi:MAG: N-acetylmuramoyl-L-alanine amidase [Armatimonadota bacterium]